MKGGCLLINDTNKQKVQQYMNSTQVYTPSNSMNSSMNNAGNVPSLNSSNAISQAEKQKIQQYMNSAQAYGQGNSMNSGGNTFNLSNSNAIGQAEKQQVRQKMNQSGAQNFYSKGLV